MNIYAGNLNYTLREDDLRAAFEGFGEVESVKIVKDFDTGRSKGFAFIVMPNDNEARMAINELDGAELDGRALKINEAKPQRRKNSW